MAGPKKSKELKIAERKEAEDELQAQIKYGAKNTPGAPTTYTREIANEILDRMASGESLNSICKDNHMPDRTTVAQWKYNDVDGFSLKYEDSRNVGLDVMADDLLTIADDGKNDWMESNHPDNPGYKANGEMTARSRLRLDTRKWYLSKLAPKRYGDRQEIELSGSLALNDMSDDDIREELAKVASALALVAVKSDDEHDCSDLV